MRSWRRSQALKARRDQGAFARLRPSRRALAYAVGAAFTASAAPSFANPSGASIAAGGVTFSVSGNLLTITNTPGAIINWQQFSIQKDEITRFIQQHAASGVLNRVIGQNPSLILGQLTSNGRVFLINPSGIAFGKSAVIDVAGFAASTLNINDADFISGRMRFTGTGAEGKLTNAGTIRTGEGGHVYLIAPNVENEKGAVITSPKGEVVIAAGKTVELVNSRTPDLRVEFAAPDNQAVNAGDIVAASGSVGIYGTLIKNSGRVSASRAEVGDGGKIVFKATKDITLESTSRLEVNGAKGGEIKVQAEGGTTLVSGAVEAKGDAGKGGDIQVLGNFVGLVDNALVDASGAFGGGAVLVGGDFQGKNADVQNAEKTYVGKDAVIRADAVTNGDGGKVIVWSDDSTRFYGALSARGGKDGGNGGFAEISGRHFLDARIDRVTLGAPKGKRGTLLLDPDAIIVNGGSSDGDDSEAGNSPTVVQQAGGNAGEVLFGDTPTPFNIYESEIEGTDANIVLKANQSISVAGTFSGGNLTILNDHSLTLQTGTTATGGIDLTSSTHGAGLEIITTGSGTINLVTGDASHTIKASKLTGAGGITIDNSIGAGIELHNDLTTSGGAVTVTGATTLAADVVVSTGAGNVTFNGRVNAATVGGQSLTVSGGTTTFAAEVGQQGDLASLTTNGGGSVSLKGVRTTGDQTYNNTGGATLNGSYDLGGGNFKVEHATTLTSDVVEVRASGTGNVTFNGTVDSDSLFGLNQFRTLIVTAPSGTVMFGDAVGATQALAKLQVNDAATVDLASVSANKIAVTAGSILLKGASYEAPGVLPGDGVTFTGAVTLGTNVVVTGSGGSGNNITFGGTLDGAHTLGLTAGAGDVIFGGAVGGATPLGAITITSAHNLTANAITAASLTQMAGTGLTTLNGAVSTTDAAGVNLETSAIAVNAGITTTNGGVVTLNADTTTLTIGANGDISSDGAVSLTGAGGIGIAGISTAGDITTTNDNITFNSAVVLTGGVAINSGSGIGNISFLSTVNGTTAGADDLTLTAGTGNVRFDDAVGAGTRVGAVSIVSANDVTATSIRAASLTHTAGTGTASITGAIDTDGAAGVSIATNTIALGSTITTTGNGGVTLNQTAGTLTLGADNDISSDGAVSLTGAGGIGLAGISMAGNVTTTNDDITYNNSAVALTGDVVVSAGAGNVTFNGTVNGAHDLTVNSGGATTFGAAVGGGTALTSLTTDASGSVSLKNVTTGGAQTYNDSSVTLNGTYNTNAGGAGGSFTANTSAPGATTTLAGDTAVSTGAGDVTFNGRVNAATFGGQSLTVSSGGTTTFAAEVGQGGDLESLTTNGGGSVSLKGVRTTGDQTYNNTGGATLNGSYDLGGGNFKVDRATTLASDVVEVRSSGTGDVTFNGTVDSNSLFGLNEFRTLIVDAPSGTVTFGDAVGAGMALKKLKVNNAATANLASITTGSEGIDVKATTINLTGTDYKTDAQAVPGPFGFGAGALKLTGNVVLKANVSMDTAGATTDNTITVTGTVNADNTANDRTLSLTAGAGSVDLQQAVGASEALNLFTVTSAATADLQAVTTSGAQNYTGVTTTTLHGALTVNTAGAGVSAGAVSLAAGSGTIMLTGTDANNDVTLGAVTGAQALNITALGGDIVLGTVGAGTPLTSVTLSAATADLQAVTTSGAQSYTGVTTTTLNGTLTVNTAGTGVSAGNVSLAAGGGTIALTGTDTGNDVTLGAVNGAQALSITALGGDIALGAAGGTTPLASVTLSANTIALQAVTSSGDQSYTAATSTTLNGNLTTDASVSGNVSFTGPVLLGADVAIDTSVGAVDGNTTFSATSTVDGAHGLTLTAGTGDVIFGGAVGGITRLGAIDINSAHDLTAAAITAASLNQDGGTGTTTLNGAVNTDTTAGVTLRNAAIVVNGGVTAIGDGVVTLNAGTGTYTQADFDVVSGSGAITVIADTLAITDNTGDDAFRTTSTLTLKPFTASRAMSLVSGPDFNVSATTLTDLTGAGTPTNIVIGDAGVSTGIMTIGGAVGLAGKSLTLHAGSVTDSGVNTITTGNLTISAINAAGGIGAAGAAIDTAVGNLVASAGTGGVFISEADGIAVSGSTTGAFSVLNAGGILSTGGAISGTDVALTGVGGISIGHTVTAAGTLGLTSTNNAIGQSNGTATISATGVTTVNAGSGGITLDVPSNNFQAAVTLTGGTTTIRDTNALTLGTLNVSGNLTAIANLGGSTGTLNLGSGSVGGNLVATSNNGLITQAGALAVTPGTATINAGTGDITLTNTANNFNSVTLTGADVSLTDTNALTATAGASGPLTLIAGAGGTGALTTGGALAGTNVALTGAGGISIGHNVTATGTLGLTSTNNTIGQTSGVIAISATGISTVNAGSGTISLDSPSNNFVGAVNLTGGTTTIRDTNALTLGTLNVSGNLTAIANLGGSTGTLNLGSGSVGGNLVATSNNGLITQAGALAVTPGTATINAGTGDITLTNTANNFNSVTLTGADVSLTDTNALTATAGASGLLTLIAGASGAGALTTGGALSGTAVALTGAGGINIGHAVTATSTLDLTSTNATIGQTSGGATITATGITTVNAGTGDIGLDVPSNNFVGAVSLTGGNISVQDTNDLAVSALTQNGANKSLFLVAGGQLTLPAQNINTGTAMLQLRSNGGTLTTPGNLTGGNITLVGSAGLTLANDVTAGGSLLLGATDNPINQTTGTINVTGTTFASAGTGTITLTQATNNFGGAVTLVSSGSSVSIRDVNDLTLAAPTLGANTGITAIAGGTLTLPAATAFSTGTGNIDFQSNGVTGTLATTGALTTTTGTISLAGVAGLTVSHAVTTSSGDVTLIGDKMALASGSIAAGSGAVVIRQFTDGTAIDLGATADTGFALSSAELGTITTTGPLRIGDANSGAISVTNNVSTGSVGSLTLTSGLGIARTGAFTITTDSLALVADAAIDVDTAVSNLAATTSAGGITIGNTKAGGLTVTLVDGVTGISSAGSAINLTEAAGSVMLVEAVNAGAGTASITLNGDDKTLTSNTAITGTGGVTLAADKMVLEGGTVAAGTASVILKTGSGTDTIAVGANEVPTASTLEISNAELTTITAGSIVIGDAAAQSGDIILGRDHAVAQATKNLQFLTSGDITVAGFDLTGNTVTLGNSAASPLTDQIKRSGAGVLNAAADLNLFALNGIGTIGGNGVRVGTVTGNLTATNTAAGDLYLETGAIALGTAQTSLSQRDDGHLRVDATGALTVGGDVSVGGTGGIISLNATGGIARTAGTVSADTVNLGTLGTTTSVGASGAPIITASANLNARSSSGDIWLSNTGDANVSAQVTAGSGLIDISNTGTLATAAGGIASSGGSVAVVATDDMTIGHNVTAGGTGTVSLTVNVAEGTLAHTAGAIDANNQLITLVADKMALTGGTIGSAAGDTVLLRSLTAGNAIDLGSLADTTANTLELSSAEIGTVQAGILRIGTASTGDITFSADVTANAGAVHLTTGGSVIAAVGGLLGNKDLAVSAGGAVTFAAASTNVNTLAVASGGAVTFVDSAGLTVGDVDGVLGVAGTTVALTASSGLLTISNGAAAADISASGPVSLTANRMDIAGSVSAAGQSVTLKTASGTDAIAVGASGDAIANTLEISNTELTQISASSIVIGDVAAQSGNITLGRDHAVVQGAKNLQFLTSGDITIAGFDVTGNTVTLGNSAASPLTDQITRSGAGALNANADLNLFALNGIGTIGGNGILVGTVTGNLSAANTASGNLYLQTGTITLGVAATTLSEQANGQLQVDSSGDIVIGGDVSVGTATGAGIVTLNAVGTITDATAGASSAGTLTAGTVKLGVASATQIGASGDAVSTATSNLAAKSSGGLIEIANNGNVAAQAQATGGAVNLLNTGDLTSGGALTSSGAGVTVAATGNLSIGHVVTAGGTGTVDLTAGTGAAADQDFTQTAGLISSGAGAINISATRNIVSSRGAQSGAITSTGGAITLTSDSDTLGGGAIALTNTIVDSGGGAITLGGSGGAAAVGAGGLLAGVDLQAARLLSAGGAITIRGQGAAADGGVGVRVISTASTDALISSGAGNITIDGTAGSAAINGHGVVVSGFGTVGDTKITSTTGNIDITGTRGSPSGVGNIGVLVQLAGEIESVDGNVTLNGGGPTGAGTNGISGVVVELTSAAVRTTGAGNISITGAAGGTGNTNIGVRVNATGRVETTGSGSIAIDGTGGGGTGGNDGVAIDNAGFVRSTGTGSITIDGTGGGTGTGTFGVRVVQGSITTAAGTISIYGDNAASGAGVRLDSAGTVGGVSTGDVLLLAQSGKGISLDGTVQSAGSVTLSAQGGGTVSQGGGSITASGAGEGLRLLSDAGSTFSLDQSNDVAVLVGSLAGTSTLSYTDTNGFSITTLTSFDGSGATTTNGLTVGTSAGAGNQVTLIAGGAVTQGGTNQSIVTNALRLSGSGTYVLQNPNNDVAILAANPSGGGPFKYTDVSGFQIGTVNTVSGISVGSNNATLTAGGTVTQTAAITAAGLELLGAGPYTLTLGTNNVTTLAGSVTNAVQYTDSDELTVGTVNLSSGLAAGDVVLSAGGQLTLAQSVNAGAGDVRFITAADVNQTGGAVTANNLGVQAASGVVLTRTGNDADTVAIANSTSGNVSYRDADGFAIGSVSALGAFTPAVDGISNANGNVTLNAGAAVTQTQAITAAGLELLGAGPYTLTLAANDVNTIAVNTGGVVSFRDADDLAVGTVNTIGIATTNDNVTLQTGGTLAIGNAVNLGTGNLTLNAGAAATQTAPITAAGLELLGSGPYTLANAGNDVATIAASGPSGVIYTDSNALAVAVVGGTTGMNVAGSIELTTLGTGTLNVNNAIVTSAGGSLTLSNAGALTLAADISADGTVTQSGGAVVTSGTRSITATDDAISIASALTIGPAAADSLTVSAGTSTISFGAAIEGPGALTATALGDTSLAGNVGAVTPLASLTFDGGGNTLLGAAVTALRTTGNQTYTDGLSLGTNTQLSTTAGGNISATTITGAGGGGQNLTLATGTGDITVSGNIGATRLGILTITSGDAVRFQGTGTQQAASLTVTSSTSTTFTGKVDLTNGANLATAAGDVSFLNGLNTGAASSFSNSGALQIGDNAADTSSISTSVVHTAGTTILGGSITSPTMTFAATTLAADSSLNATGAVSFNSTLNGPGGLAVHAAGLTTFSDDVGLLSALAFVTSDSGNTTSIASGKTVRTTGAQTYVDKVTADNLTLVATNTAAGPTAGDIAATEVTNDFTGTLNLAGHTVQITDANSLTLGSGTMGGSARIIALDGSITTGLPLFTAADGIVMRAHDAGGADVVGRANITIGSGGISATNAGAPILLHAADNITVNGGVTAANGRIEFIAGMSSGLDTTQIANFATETTADNVAAIRFNAPVNAGVTGQIVIVTAVDGAYVATHQSDVSQGVNGGLNSGALGVVTLKGNTLNPGNNIGGDILLDTATTPQNTNPNVQFLTCLSDGCPTPLPGNPVMPVNGGSAYSAGQIRYIGAGGVNLTGIGTVGDFVSSVTGSFTLTANPFSAGNVTIQATDDIVIDLANVLEKISDLPASTLNFSAGRSIFYVNPTYSAGGRGKTIGAPGAPFRNNLKFSATDSIVLNNAIYQGAGNLDLLAGSGDVTLLGSFAVYTGGNVRVTGRDFSLLGYGGVVPFAVAPTSPPTVDTSRTTAPDGANPAGQELVASGTVNLINSGVITVRAGTATGTSTAPLGRGARLQGGTVNIGSAGTPASNPTQLVIWGGDNDNVGYSTADPNDQNILLKQANAVVDSQGDMNIYLRSAPGPAGVPLPPSLTNAYSLVVRGGTARANNSSGADPLIVTAIGALQAQNLVLETGGHILFQGGTATLETGNAAAVSSALLKIGTNKTITTKNGGSVVLMGGTANVSSTDPRTGLPMSATTARNSQAMAQMDPSKLTMTVDGILVVQGGKTTGPQGSLASARIDAGDEIRITVNGTGSYTYSPSTGGSSTLTGGSFYMIGSSDSGFFDANSVDLAGSLSYPQAFPITVSLAGSFQKVFDLGLAGSVVQTGLTTFDDSLLSYVIFAANVETRALRFRQGLGEGDDIGAPACK